MAQGLKDAGVGRKEIAEQTGLAEDTVTSICSGKGRWSDLTKNGEVFRKYRTLMKERMTGKAMYIADQLLDSVQDARNTGTVSQRAIAYGILRQHQRLDVGEATSNVAVLHRTDLEALDKLAAKLSNSLVKGDQ